MALIGIAREMPAKPPTVAWQFGIGHIVIVHDDSVPSGTQGIVCGAWLNGSVAVMMPDLHVTRNFYFNVLELIGVMPRFVSSKETA